MWKGILAILVLIVLVVGFGYWLGTAHHVGVTADTSSINTTVTQFGTTMQKVSLSAPDAKDEIGAAYSPYASADLLAQWEANIQFAPGRSTSSPWPAYIQIASTTLQNDGTYEVHGMVMEMTSNEVAHGGVAASFPVTMVLKKFGDQWLMTSYQAGPTTVLSTSSVQ